MTMQQEFCFFAYSKSQYAARSQLSSASYLRIKHLARRTQAITLGDQIVDLLATLQYAFDGLVQNSLGLIQLVLDLGHVVHL